VTVLTFHYRLELRVLTCTGGGCRGNGLASVSPRDCVDDGAGVGGGGQKPTFTQAALSVGLAQLLAFFHIST